jgi:ribonuclease D
VQTHYIQEQQALIDVCRQFSDSDYLAIDTEFVRTRTYFPNLGLLQVCDGQQIALIDPIAIDDLTPFWQLLVNPSIQKVLHACSEDLEVFQVCGETKPVNIIDSQIMMAFLGHGISMGYAAMIEHFSALQLDKSESRTDWLKRPLSEQQLAYAAADVHYLHQWFPTMLQQLSSKGLLAAAIQETERMVEKKFASVEQSSLYLQVKASWKLSSEQLNRLQHLAIWRYQQAIVRNLPLSFVAKDHSLLALAERNPTNVGAMAQLPSVDILDVRHQGKAMLTVLKQANLVAAIDYPAPIVRLEQLTGYKKLFAKVKLALTEFAAKQQIPVEVLASKKQINQLLSWHFQINQQQASSSQIELLQNWRGELLEDTLLVLLQQ